MLATVSLIQRWGTDKGSPTFSRAVSRIRSLGQMGNTGR